jgi:RNA-directed DNA polymerase
VIQRIASDEVLDQAYAWLCKQRSDASHNNDVWRLRSEWIALKEDLKKSLLNGSFRLGCTRRYEIEGKPLEVWSAVDALVLKAIALVLLGEWDGWLSDRCFHLAGRGGVKAAVRELAADLARENRPQDCPDSFVFKTDVKHYYASIDHDVLLKQLRERIDDPIVLKIVNQYVRRCIYDGGLYEDVQQGITLGCPLSPLIGALYLHEIDEAMEERDVFYARFMDDWVIVAPSRWKLREAVAVVNKILNQLKVEQHPDKTFIGRVSKGFDFLGYHFMDGMVRVAKKTVEKFVRRVERLATIPARTKRCKSQLYEQAPRDKRSREVEFYVKRFVRWTTAGLAPISMMLEEFSGDDVVARFLMRRSRQSQES